LRAAGSGLSAIDDEEISELPVKRPASRAAVEAKPHSSMLLQALKEELFDLEVEHKQGHISQQEYEKTKAALDQTLQRALKRDAAKQT
jgi:hypothetical protein